MELCDKAHKLRVKEAEKLSKEIEKVLEDLNFLKVSFSIDVNKKDNFKYIKKTGYITQRKRMRFIIFCFLIIK